MEQSPIPGRFTLSGALAFGALVGNPKWPFAQSDSWKVITAENVDLWIQPIDLAGRWITLARGSRVRTMVAGHRFDDRSFAIPPPLDLHTEGVCSFDADSAAAVYEVLYRVDPRSPTGTEHSFAQALRWWVKSWMNSAGLSNEDRIIYLRTAIDALTGTDKTHVAKERLEEMFASIGRDERGDLIWVPTPRTFARVRAGRSFDETAFGHWLHAFADQRNEIVHKGRATQESYDVAGSPFVGPYVDVAERVVREALQVKLHELGHTHLWRSAGFRAALRRLTADS